MKHHCTKTFIQFFTLILPFSLAIACPASRKIYPCTCKSAETSEYIKCSDIDNEEILTAAVEAMKGMKYLYSFTFEKTVLNYIPHNLFKGITLTELDFKDSSIMAFTDTDVAFEGLEDSLEILLVTDCTFMNSWDFSLLKNMQKLMRIEIVHGDIVSIEEDIKQISHLNLQDISFSHNEISYVYDHAFADFQELVILTLSNNLIKEVKRSMLPNPAPKLQQIDLGYNEIEQLPDDFFENMTSLENLSIPSNKILVLKEKTFAPVWGQLEFFLALNNQLRCDCRISWIFEKRMPERIRAVCAQPVKLKGRGLDSLESSDVWCSK